MARGLVRSERRLGYPNSQDWDDSEVSITTDQLKVINRSLKEIGAEPIDEQLEAIVR
jgi:hypothetical protein